MPKVSLYSDDDILRAIGTLVNEGKRATLTNIAEICPVNRNRIQRNSKIGKLKRSTFR